MSKPREGYWSYIRHMIRKYPEHKKELFRLRDQSITASANGMPSGGGVSRTTEVAALRELPAHVQRELTAVEKAIEETEKMKTGKARLRIIELVHWKKSHTLEGAGLQTGYSYAQARQFHGDFLRLVAKYFFAS